MRQLSRWITLLFYRDYAEYDKTLNNRGSLAALQLVMGQASITTTIKYARIGDDIVRREQRGWRHVSWKDCHSRAFWHPCNDPAKSCNFPPANLFLCRGGVAQLVRAAES